MRHFGVRSLSVLEHFRLTCTKCLRPTLLESQVGPSRSISLSQRTYGLGEFFDAEENWGKTGKIVVGRPWRTDELRLKSNQDLHKLWYVLLKERNMVMTMMEAHKAKNLPFPSPERIEKVEESMENLLDVVAERDRAYNVLETGETGEPGRRWVINALGKGVWRRNTEHTMPIHENPGWKRDSQLPKNPKWATSYKRLHREEMNTRETKKKDEEKKFDRVKQKNLPEEHYYADKSHSGGSSSHS